MIWIVRIEFTDDFIFRKEFQYLSNGIQFLKDGTFNPFARTIRMIMIYPDKIK